MTRIDQLLAYDLAQQELSKGGTMKLTKYDKLCKYYVKGGLCSSLEAPKPQHSRCIGKTSCGDYKVEGYKKDEAK